MTDGALTNFDNRGDLTVSERPEQGVRTKHLKIDIEEQTARKKGYSEDVYIYNF